MRCPPVRRSRTAGEFSATDESSLSEGAVNENARRGPKARGRRVWARFSGGEEHLRSEGSRSTTVGAGEVFGRRAP